MTTDERELLPLDAPSSPLQGREPTEEMLLAGEEAYWAAPKDEDGCTAMAAAYRAMRAKAKPPVQSVKVGLPKLTADDQHIGVVMFTDQDGKDNRVSVKEWNRSGRITFGILVGAHTWAEATLPAADALKVAALIFSKPAVKALASPSAPEEWQDISTAPASGPDPVLLGYFADQCPKYGVGFYTKVGDGRLLWDWNWGMPPTHWRPLPAPPQGGQR